MGNVNGTLRIGSFLAERGRVSNAEVVARRAEGGTGTEKLPVPEARAGVNSRVYSGGQEASLPWGGNGGFFFFGGGWRAHNLGWWFKPETDQNKGGELRNQGSDFKAEAREAGGFPPRRNNLRGETHFTPILRSADGFTPQPHSLSCQEVISFDFRVWNWAA